MSNSLRSHGLQHSGLPCLSPSPGVCSNSCPLSRWCHPIISSSAAPSSFCLQSFLASGSFPMSQLFAWGGQSIRASATVLPMSMQGWLPLGLTGLISLLSKGLSRVCSSTAIQKHPFFSAQPSLWSTSHICTWLLEVLWLWLYRPLSAKWCFCFWICCRFVIAFLPRSKCLNFRAPITVHSDFGAQENKICHCFPFYLHEVMGPDAMILVFWMLSFKPVFSLSSFTFIKKL